MAINDLEQELTQGIYERDYQVDNSIAYNHLTQTADSQTSYDILNNKDGLPLPPSFYNQNTELYKEDKKKSNYEKLQEMYSTYKGLANIAADGSLYQISVDNHNEIIQQEKLLAQKEFDDRNFFYRLNKGIQADLASRDLSRLYYDLDEMEQQGLDTKQLQAEIQAKEQEIAQIPTGTEGFTNAKSLASWAASMWDMKGIVATDIATTAAINAWRGKALGPKGAAVGGLVGAGLGAAKAHKYLRPVIVGGATYSHSREVEIGSMLRDLRAEGVTSADAREAAHLYGNISAFIETAGFFSGADIALGQIRKGLMQLVKSGGKEAVQEIAKKKLTKEAIIKLGKDFAKGFAKGGVPSTLSEMGEEGLQGELSEEIKARLERGESVDSDDLMTYASVLGGAYERFVATNMEIAEYFINGKPLSEHALQMLDSYKMAGIGSLIGGGFMGGTGGVISTMATEYAPKSDQEKFNDALTNTQKTNGFKEFIRNSEIQKQSPEAGNMITDKILEANDLPKTLWFAEDALVEIINASQNDEDLSTLLAPLNLQEKIEKSVDGMVEVDINTSKVLFSEKADKVFTQLADNISWSQDALTPKQAKESLARTATDNMFGVQTGTVDALERKLLESYPEEKRADKSTRELARGNAVVALHIANAMSGATGRSTQEIAEEILNNIVVGDDGMAAVDNVIKSVLKQEGWHGGRELEGGKFSLKYAGKQTGLAHGYGVYASKQRNTAEDYRSRVDYNFTVKGENIASIHRKLMENNEFEKASLLEDLQLGKDVEAMYEGQEVKQWYVNNIKPFLKSEGKLYKLELPEDFELINEQATFEEQPEDIQEALLATAKKMKGFGLLEKAIKENAYGGDLYIALGKDVFYEQKGYEGGSTEIQETASMYLDKLGVKGITYDGGSEGQNFVIFNPDNAKILDKFYQYIGPQANLTTELRAALDKAEQMQADGTDNEKIRQETGWDFREGHWRYELDDSKAILNKNNLRVTKAVSLDKVYVHPELYELYPFLKNITIKINNKMYQNARVRVEVNRHTGEVVGIEGIDVKTDNIPDSMIKERIIHEIQHAIQFVEGWQQGGSVKMFKEPKMTPEQKADISDISYLGLRFKNELIRKKINYGKYDVDVMAFFDKDGFTEILKNIDNQEDVKRFWSLLDKNKDIYAELPYTKYFELYGENEARTAARRANLTAEQRRNTPFSASTDINPTPVAALGGVELPIPTIPATEQTTAGYFDPATLEIRLTSATNPTTFAHEMFHYFIFNMTKAYNEGTMTEEWRKQFENAMNWAGLEKDANGKYDLSPSNPKVKVAQEKLAEGFTSYIAKGKAPSKQTATLFNILKDWFMFAYTSLKRKRVKLNKSVTKFYDQVFSINGDVEARLEAERIGALSRPEGMTDEDWNKYMELKEQARGAAFGKALEAMVKAAKEKLSDAYKAKEKELYEQKLAELNNTPEFKAWKRAKEEGILISSVEDVIGNGKRPYKNFLSDVGIHINLLVQESGFPSVAEFVEFINKTKSPETLAKEYAEEQANIWMEERNPELKDIKSKNAVRTVASIKVAVMEYMMLKGIPMSQFNTYFNEMRKATETVIAQSEVRDIINPEKWYKRLTNLLDRINVAQSQGDMNKLAQLKWRAAFINYIIIQSKSLNAQYQRFGKHIQKFKDAPNSQQLKKIEGKVWNMITDALNRWGLTKRNTSNDSVKARVDNYIDELLEYGYSADAELIKDYTYLLDNPDRTRFKKITTSDFRKLYMVLNDLEVLSSQQRKIIVEGKELYIQDAVDKVVASAKAKGIKSWTDKSNIVKELFVDFMGIPETQLESILPSDVFGNFVLEFQNGLSKAEQWRTVTSKRLYDILAPVMQYQNREVIIEGRGWKVSELMVMMLNMGNEHNLDCLAHTLARDGKVSKEYRMEETINILENAQSAISSEGITGFDIRDVAQQVWDLFAEYVPAMKEAQERLDGKEITMVEARPHTFLDGKVLRGGYYPARDAEKTGSNQDSHDMSFVQKTFSMTIERGEREHRIPTDLTLLNGWLSQMGKLLYVAEPANNLEKLAKSDDFRNALGSRTSRYIMDWLNSSIVPEKTSAFFARLSLLSSVYILGGKIVSIPVQMLGIVSAFVNVGYGRCLLSLGKLATVKGGVDMTKHALGKSVYMKNRYENPMNHLLGLDDLGKLITPKMETSQKFVLRAMMKTVEFGDMLASVTVWDAAYNKAIEQGYSEEKAILYADSAVRTTQSDTSAGARARAMRGTLRYLSPFTSFFIAAHNLVSSKAIWGGSKEKVQAMVSLVALCILSPILETLVKAPFEFYGMTEEERRKKKIHSMTDYFRAKWKGNVIESTGNIIFPAFGVAGDIVFYTERGYHASDNVLPLTSLKKIVNIPTDIYKSFSGKTDKQRDKAEKQLFNALGLAVGGVNVDNLEKSYRVIYNIIDEIRR